MVRETKAERLLVYNLSHEDSLPLNMPVLLVRLVGPVLPATENYLLGSRFPSFHTLSFFVQEKKRTKHFLKSSDLYFRDC